MHTILPISKRSSNSFFEIVKMSLLKRKLNGSGKKVAKDCSSDADILVNLDDDFYNSSIS